VWLSPGREIPDIIEIDSSGTTGRVKGLAFRAGSGTRCRRVCLRLRNTLS
jgi:hypothetical protein